MREEEHWGYESQNSLWDSQNFSLTVLELLDIYKTLNIAIF